MAITGVIFFGAADGGIAHAFELSLIQLAAVAAGIVVVSRLLPRIAASESGIRQMSHKPNKSPIRWLRRHGARPDRHLAGSRRESPSCYACFDLAPEQIAAAAHAVAATAAERFRITEMSADDVVELRELTALADELGELRSGASTLVLRPARLSTLLDAVARLRGVARAGRVGPRGGPPAAGAAARAALPARAAERRGDAHRAVAATHQLRH